MLLKTAEVSFQAMMLLACLMTVHADADAGAGHRPQIAAVSEKMLVRADNMIGSGIDPEGWANHAENSDPFAASNKYFKIYIVDRSTKKEIVRPTVPLDALWISPNSKFILGISFSYPTAGVVVFDSQGKLAKKDFNVCLSANDCSYIADYGLVWTDLQTVKIAFESVAKEDDCLLKISNENSGMNASLVYDLCEREKKYRNRTSKH